MTQHFVLSPPEAILDRPVWEALASNLGPIAKCTGTARSLPTDISPLAACAGGSVQSIRDFCEMIQKRDAPVLTLEKNPMIRGGALSPVAEFAGVQMIARNVSGPKGTHLIQSLGESDVEEMLALTKLTQPGPFEKRTHVLGDYIGIKRDGRLVAMAGQRLRLPDFTEISAVCVAPEYRWLGMGAELIRYMCEHIRASGCVPFLHTFQSNTNAIELYRHLGFELRANMQIAKWCKEPATTIA